jgi:predicted DNA-binding transcriptional regulator AlpA
MRSYPSSTTKVLPSRRTIRRHELRQIVPLAETTIYELERRGEFPRRFNLTPRCVVWDPEEVENWPHRRKQASRIDVGTHAWPRPQTYGSADSARSKHERGHAECILYARDQWHDVNGIGQRAA